MPEYHYLDMALIHRAIDYLKQYQHEFVQVASSKYRVPSQEDPSRCYYVEFSNHLLSMDCTCPHNHFRVLPCKHLLAVYLWKQFWRFDQLFVGAYGLPYEGDPEEDE